MAAKRRATSELNCDNWDVEDTPEEAGTFTKAPEDVCERRVIKTVRRRLPANEGIAKSAFGSFTGFEAAPASSSPFSFLANVTSNVSGPPAANTVQNNNTTSNGALQNTENGADKTKNVPQNVQTTSSTLIATKDPTKKEENKIFKKSSDYFAKLKGLNESVAQWIKTHVDANPFCILTPIFRDYEKYLKDIEAQHGKEAEKKEEATKSTDAITTETTTKDKTTDNSPFVNITKSSTNWSEWKPEKSAFSNVVSNTKSIFGNAEQKTDTQKTIFGNIDGKSENKKLFGNVGSEKNPFLSKSPIDEGWKLDTKSSNSSCVPQASVNTATFSFGESAASSTASAGFSFGSVKPFSFGTQAVKPQESEEKAENDDKDEDDEPPKPDFKPVTEAGAIYEQRCKVFVKKDGNFSDKGVGTLFLKPTPNEKTQLIVRADTSLGNLLLNTLLTENIPTKRMNKNTVMMVCLPMPDFQPPPIPVLLRVKTSEDADVLLETLNKHKK